MAEDFQDVAMIAVSRLSANQSYSFQLRPDAALRAEIAADLGLISLKKARLVGTIAPHGADDWLLRAALGASVQQPCVISLEPVGARVEEPVERLFLREMPEFCDLEEDAEIEMPEDERAEPLGSHINLVDVFREALALAIPSYPRAEGVALQGAVFTEAGKTALTDEDSKPFAGLAALKAKLQTPEE